MGRKTQIVVDGNPLDVREEDFEIVREDWNEYKLLDGGTIRAKMTMQRIFRVLDEKGNPAYTPDGDPHVIVRHSVTIVAID